MKNATASQEKIKRIIKVNKEDLSTVINSKEGTKI